YGTPAARKNGTRRALAAGPYCATRSAIVGSCTTGGGAGRGRRTGALQPAIATIATSAIRRRRAVGETTLIRHAPHRVRRRAVPAPSTSPKPSFVLRVPSVVYQASSRAMILYDPYFDAHLLSPARP